MCNLKKCVIGAACLSGMILLSGCVVSDTYYVNRSYGVVPVYPVYMNGEVVAGEYYQSESVLITNWPYHSRPYIQRDYYYTWY